MISKERTVRGCKGRISRRRFLAHTAATTAAFTIVPRHVLGGPGHTPPSEKLNVAGVGVGGMGASNLFEIAGLEMDEDDNILSREGTGENIVALCDVDDEFAGRVYEIFPKAKRYRDFRRMLEKQKDIDAVVVATPDHTHAVVAMAAMQLGKHVYVQKPLTHTVYEARMLTEAARRYKVATQMGNQGNSGEGVRLICEWIWDGAIGPVHEVHSWTDRPVWPQGIPRPKETPHVPKSLDWDLWLGPAPVRPYHPTYHPFSWRAWWDFGTGALGDMACHILDPAFSALKLKYPTSVEASCSTYVAPGKMWEKEENTESFPRASVVHYTFGAREGMPEVKLHWYDGGMMPQRSEEFEPRRRLPESGAIFVGEKGLLLSRTYGESPRIIPESKMKAYKRPPKTIPRVKMSHEQNWITACKGGRPACSNFDYAGPLTEMVLLGNIALRYPGERLEWDGQKMKVTNIDEANQYVQPRYRSGWNL
ncbi:MAG TPA: Gfo/Idh/MocA family oxidoreductase [Planctomycetes bacterium]|nr:Gfo/Idh/MocA family oxidoreductase [Planctomycetota bacterium]